jgi:hypothetical protein
MDPDKLVEAILKVSRAFMLERIVYLIGASASVLLVLYLAFTNLNKEFDQSLAFVFLGSGGLFATTGVGVLYAFNKTLGIIEKLLSQHPGGGGGATAGGQGGGTAGGGGGGTAGGQGGGTGEV